MRAGVVNLLKPPGMTSHDAVAWLRRALGEQRVGHAGTLDPLAAGVLLLLVGRATGAARYFAELPKRYRAEVVFGLVTDSGDFDGRLLRQEPCPGLEPARVAAVLPRFRGRIRQRPPARAAIKVGGVPAYRRARRGEQLVLPEREVEVHRLELVDWQAHALHPRALLDVECSSGTYVRSLARDLGEAVGTGACLAFLLRTAVGPFTAAEAWTLEELERSLGRGDAAPVIPLEQALGFLAGVTLDAREARAVSTGRIPAGVHGRIRAVAPEGSAVRLLGPSGALVAVARREGDGARLERVFAAPGGELPWT